MIVWVSVHAGTGGYFEAVEDWWGSHSPVNRVLWVWGDSK